MKLNLIVLSLLVSTWGIIEPSFSPVNSTPIVMETEVAPAKSFYDFKVNSLEGQPVSFAKFKGKKVLLINVASECGYTPQYADWEKFHEQYGDKVIVVGIPANNFGGQEPGTAKEIATFCQKNYGVKFQMLEKVSVKGEDQHPLYQWLTKKELNGWNTQEPTWNFCKYLINEKGELIKFFNSKVKPTDKEFLEAAGIKS